MKAITNTRYGNPEVLQLKEVEKPLPKENEVLIKIMAIPVATEDPLQRKGKPYLTRLFFGLFKPKNTILGAEFSGVVVGTGDSVTFFKSGDAVFGHVGKNLGCYAQYVCANEKGLILKKPTNKSHEEVAPVCTFMAAWNFMVDMADVKEGQRVLINGASGAVGSAALQMAKHRGAHVTGVCSTSNVDMVKALGADVVIDYKRTNFLERGEVYDVIFDVANKSSFSKSKSALSKNGLYLNPALQFPVLFQMLWTRVLSNKRVKFSATGLLPISKRKQFLKGIIELFEAGKLTTIIGKEYTLEQMVEAHKHIESGHKKGNLVVTMNQ